MEGLCNFLVTFAEKDIPFPSFECPYGSSYEKVQVDKYEMTMYDDLEDDSEDDSEDDPEDDSVDESEDDPTYVNNTNGLLDLVNSQDHDNMAFGFYNVSSLSQGDCFGHLYLKWDEMAVVYGIYGSSVLEDFDNKKSRYRHEFLLPDLLKYICDRYKLGISPESGRKQYTRDFSTVLGSEQNFPVAIHVENSGSENDGLHIMFTTLSAYLGTLRKVVTYVLSKKNGRAMMEKVLELLLRDLYVNDEDWSNEIFEGIIEKLQEMVQDL